MLKNVSLYLAAEKDQLLDPRKWDKMSKRDLDAAAQLIMRFALLDRLVDASCLPRHPNFFTVSRSAVPPLTQKLYKVNGYSFLESTHESRLFRLSLVSGTGLNQFSAPRKQWIRAHGRVMTPRLSFSNHYPCSSPHSNEIFNAS
jgi:hypothetical protein